MVSTITPVVYRRHRRINWLVAVVMFSMSAGIGGSAIGAILALAGQEMWKAHSPFISERWAVFALVAAFYSLHEFGIFRLPCPQRAWQVPPSWRVHLPPWVTASSYGFLLGMGVLTRIPVSTFYLLLVWCLFAAHPAQVGPVFGIYGLSQGLPLLFVGWSGESWDRVSEIAVKSWSFRTLVHKVNAAVLMSIAIITWWMNL
jgi:hypothetical protein